MNATVGLSEATLERARAIFAWYMLIVRSELGPGRYRFDEVAEQVGSGLAHRTVVIRMLLKCGNIPDYETVRKEGVRLLHQMLDERELKVAFEDFSTPLVIEGYATPIDDFLGQVVALTPKQIRSVNKRLKTYKAAFQGYDLDSPEDMRAIAEAYPDAVHPVFIAARAPTSSNLVVNVTDLWAAGVKTLGGYFSEEKFRSSLFAFKLDFCLLD